MRVSVLLGRLRTPGEGLRSRREDRARRIVKRDAFHLDIDKVAIAEEYDLVRVLKDGNGVGGDELLALPKPNGKGRLASCSNDSAWLVTVHGKQRPLPFQLSDAFFERLTQVALVRLFDEMGDHLGVYLRTKAMAASLQGNSKLGVVLNNPVVDHGNSACLIKMRVGIRVCWCAMCCPAGVCHACGFRSLACRYGCECRLEVGKASCALGVAQLRGAGEGDPSRVVAAVLEETQAADEKAPHIARSDVADNSAHAGSLPLVHEAGGEGRHALHHLLHDRGIRCLAHNPQEWLGS